MCIRDSYNGDTYNGNVVTCAPAGAMQGTQPIGVLCQRIEQATSDTDGSQGFSATTVGSPRTWTFTYNANGQVLTADGPRTDVPDVTTYAYYANNDADINKRGNVATITNALNHGTGITSYNPHGQPLSVTDPVR